MRMDLERNRVIDWLADRYAESLAAWWGSPPEVEILRRDRSRLYADGGRQGAPSAVPIPDRHHLVSHLSEAAERDIQPWQRKARAEVVWRQPPATKTYFGGGPLSTMPETLATRAIWRCWHGGGKATLSKPWASR
jgi:transposase